MIVPLSVSDFLDRAETVYGERTGVVDEPDQPAASLGHDHLRRDGPAGAPARGEARRARHRVRRAGGHGQPQQRAPADGVLGRERLRAGARAGELPAVAATRSPTSSSTPAPCAVRRPRARRTPERHRGRAHASCIGSDDDSDGRRAASTRAVGARRERHGHHQLHVRHDRPAQGRADDAPQHLGQRRRRSAGTRVSATATSTCTRCRCSTATAGGCRSRWPAMGVPQVVLRKVDGTEILRRVERHGVTIMCAAPAVVAAVLDAAPTGTARSPVAAGCASWWRAPRRRPGRSCGSRRSSAGSSSRSTASPRPRRC